jgi:hypothetical protein
MGSKDLNEDTLLEALIAIEGAGPKPKLNRLLATEEGIDYMEHRIATDPAFRKSVQEHAARNPEYRAFLEEIGIVLD